MTEPESRKTLLGLNRRQVLAASTGIGGLLAGAWLHDTEDPIVGSSPNDNVRVEVRPREKFPTYSLLLDGHTVVRSSRLGLAFVHDDVEVESLSAHSVERDSVRKTWRPRWGSKRRVRDAHEKLSIEFATADRETAFEVEFRIFDDGVGFRYVIPDDVLKRSTPVEERTRFEFDDAYQTWHPTSSGVNILGPRPLSELQEAVTPVTMQAQRDVSPQYLAVHEAALFDAPSMHLSSVDSDTLASELPGEVSVTSPYRTPWRVVLFGDRPGDLVEADVVLNLNPPCRVEDTSWIRPGKATWDWRIRGVTVDDFEYGIDDASLKRLIDFAAENEFRYTLVDAGWYGDERDPASDPTEPRPGLDIRSVVEYGRSKGIGVLLYVNDTALRKYDIDDVFQTYADWGVAGIKHGFLQGNARSDVTFVTELLEKTAEYRLVYNVHEAYKPTGERRTYPHFLTREFAQATADGQPRGYASPEYRVLLPFVNMLGGPLDVTPGLFAFGSAESRENVLGSVRSTVVAQLALCVVVRTGLLHLPDYPEAYEAKPDIFEFVRDLPPMDWDETRVLDGEIGSHVTVARRSGESWFVGCLTDEEARKVEIPLSFLQDGSTYQATAYADGPNAHFRTNPEAYEVRQETVTLDATLTGRLRPGGGYAVKLVPE